MSCIKMVLHKRQYHGYCKMCCDLDISWPLKIDRIRTGAGKYYINPDTSRDIIEYELNDASTSSGGVYHINIL